MAEAEAGWCPMHLAWGRGEDPRLRNRSVLGAVSHQTGGIPADGDLPMPKQAVWTKIR